MRRSGILDDGEVVVVDARRHFSGCAFFLFVSVVSIVALGYGWSSWHGAPRALHETFAYLAAGLGIVALARVARFRSHHVIVTNDRIVFVRGVLRRRTDEVLLSEVTGAAREQRLRDRLVAKGSLRVGVRGFDQPLMINEMVRPRSLAAAINAAVAPPAAVDPRASTRSGADVRHQLTHLETLWRKGVITADELADKRSQIGI